MANLKSLSRRVALTKAKREEPPKKKVTPRVDRSVEKAIKASQISVTGALTVGFKSMEALLKKILNSSGKVVAEVDDGAIERAVARGMEAVKLQEVELPERKPISYRATIERRGQQMIGARIDPISE